MLNITLWLLLALMWSSSYAAIKLGVDTIASMPLVAGRMIIGASIMLLVLKFRGMSLSKEKDAWISYAFTGLVGSVIPFLLITYGEHHVESGLAAILMGISPVATVLLAHVVLSDENLTTRSVVGVFVGLSGLVLLVGLDALTSIGGHVLAQLAIIAAAICYSISTIYIKRKATRPPLEMAAGSMLVGAVCIVTATIIFGNPAPMVMPSAGSMMAVLYLGVFPTALATLIYFFLVPRLGANRMSQVNFAVPIGGALIGIFLLDEIITPENALALTVIMIAIYLVTSKAKQK